MGKINFALLNCSAVNYSPVNVSGAGFAAGGGGKKSYTVAELCAMGYGVATDYGYNMTGDFAAAGVPIPTDLAARLAGEDGVLLKVTGLKADAAFWEAVRQALAEVTVNWSDPLRNYFNGTNIGGDVEMTVTGGEYQTVMKLGGQGLRKLTLNLPSGFVSVMSNAFIWAVSLEEFVVNGTVKANDWTGAFDHCTALTSFTAPQWNGNASLAAYSYGVSYMTSAFQYCTALTTVPQYGTEREADANTLRPVAMQNMLNASGVTVLGPVVDLRYIDPAGTQAAGAFGTQLQDARLMNLNHGDWWFDGTAPEDGVGHGNLAGLDAASVEYLMANLWDLTTDKTGKNWRTVDNSFMMWTVDSPAALDGDAAVSIPARSRSGAQASYVWTSQGLTGWTVRVSGLQSGDKLCIGNVGSEPGDDAITTDGDYTLTWSGAGYVVIFNDEEVQPTGAVRLEIVNEPYDEGNHLVDAAALHVPEGWRAKLTTDILASAVARGWSVWIGEENLTAGLPSIFDSLVLWYDIEKQGATNETMAENPVLKDLSGHGHDATCYNFGWTEGSGISTTDYPGALVSDGVDDYAYVGGLPILNKENGFTVIAKRKWIGDPRSKSQGFISKGTNAAWRDGAFYFEGVEGGGSALFNRVFDSSNAKDGINYISKFTSEDITYLTSKKYNNSELKNIGDGIDTDRLVIFKLGTDINNSYSSIALYSVLLFDRDLTEEEIEWVKANIMADPEPEPTPELDASLVDAWIFSGYRNEDAPKSVTGEKGHALTLRNFAFTEGSGFADGCLVTDGVDDYGSCADFPIKDTYTLIVKFATLKGNLFSAACTTTYFDASGARKNGIFPIYIAPGVPYALMMGRTKNVAASSDLAAVWMNKEAFCGEAYDDMSGQYTPSEGQECTVYVGKLDDRGIYGGYKLAYWACYDKVMTQEEAEAEIAKLDALWEARKG